MNDARFISVSKLDAAKRQLEHAIKLFFHYGDPIVIHTLNAAAYQILRDLGKKQGITSMMYKEMMNAIKPEKRAEMKKLLTKAENFFKHADRDSDKILKFYYLTTEYTIWDACLIYTRLTKENVPIFLLFHGWFVLKHNNIISDEKMKEEIKEYSSIINHEDRNEFLKLLPELENKLLK